MFTLHNITKTADLRGYIVSSAPCPTCQDVFQTVVTPDKLYAYNQGAYVQDVLSHLTMDVRERFISGYCTECWDKLFGYADEDEEYIDYYAESSLFGDC